MRFISTAALALIAGNVYAQRITVQQPVVRNISVSTVVSVPDRGGIYLGGVKRAGGTRSQYGPFSGNRSVGKFAEHTGMSAHAYIHDFDAFDRRLLQEAVAKTPKGPRLSGYAEHAFQQLAARPVTTRAATTASRRPAVPSRLRSYRGARTVSRYPRRLR